MNINVKMKDTEIILDDEDKFHIYIIIKTKKHGNEIKAKVI